MKRILMLMIVLTAVMASCGQKKSDVLPVINADSSAIADTVKLETIDSCAVNNSVVVDTLK